MADRVKADYRGIKRKCGLYIMRQGGTRPIFWDETETEKLDL